LELEIIILSEVCQVQKAKGHMFFSFLEIHTLYKYKQYYEKQVMPREVTDKRGKVKEGS
jgi:hypothetical protein